MKLSDLLELLLLAALWGASFLLMRIAAPVLNPVWLIELRVAIAGLVLLLLLIRLNIVIPLLLKVALNVLSLDLAQSRKDAKKLIFI